MLMCRPQPAPQGTAAPHLDQGREAKMAGVFDCCRHKAHELCVPCRRAGVLTSQVFIAQVPNINKVREANLVLHPRIRTVIGGWYLDAPTWMLPTMMTQSVTTCRRSCRSSWIAYRQNPHTLLFHSWTTHADLDLIFFGLGPGLDVRCRCADNRLEHGNQVSSDEASRLDTAG